MTGEITGEAKKASEGMWVLGGGIELLCVYYLFGSRKHEARERKQIYKAQTALYGPSLSINHVHKQSSLILCYVDACE